MTLDKLLCPSGPLSPSLVKDWDCTGGSGVSHGEAWDARSAWDAERETVERQ